MELFDYSLWGAPLALGIALVALVWRRWMLPLVFGSSRCHWVPSSAGSRGNGSRTGHPGLDFGSEFEGSDWVIGFASVAALFGALLVVWLSARRSRT
jgi:hypothetical protein